MNKCILWISAVFVTALALSLNAFAQPGGPGPGPMRGGGTMMGGPGIGTFIQNPEFVKMLELTAEQKDALQKIVDEARAQRSQQQQGGGTPPNFEEMRQRMDEFQAKISNVLKPEQQTKLREIFFQLTNGLDAPRLDIRMLEILVLTDEQKAKIRQILDERGTALRTAMQGFDFRGASQEEREKFRANIEARSKTYSDQIKAVLTAEQKAKAEELIAGAAELREKLGIPPQPQPGQGRPQGQDRGPRQGQQGGGSEYRPGTNSWRPGQDVPPGSGGMPSGNSRFRNDTLRNNTEQ